MDQGSGSDWQQGLQAAMQKLEKPPSFFKEAGPVTQKQTKWVTIRDFTDGEALKHRLHILTFRKEVLGKKHYEEIIYSKAMLYLKSCTTFPSSNSLFFDNVGSSSLSNDPHGNSASQHQQQAAVTVQGTGSFLGEMDQLIQPQEEYSRPSNQNSSVGNGVCNQTEEMHGLTGWGNRESAPDDDDEHFSCPNRQFLDPSLDMPRTRNEHEGDNRG